MARVDVEWLEMKYSADPCAFIVGEEGSLCGFLKRAAATGPWTGGNMRCRECEKELKRLKKLAEIEDDEGGFDLASLVERT